ncbi:MAG: heparinase II/III family protein [Hyphomicrobiaceae bacterium]|nr:heparinase II/III family protein [Hyphomicrobiaceae bacterium]
MTRPTIGERLALATLAGRRAQATVQARAAGIPLLGRRLVRALADELRFLPSDLRSADPSLLDELATGQLGLAGLVYEIGKGSPFAIAGAETSWLRELHGFTWLGGLRAAGGREAQDRARLLVTDWCRRFRGRPGGTGVAATPDVIARRVVAWIVNAGLLIEGATPDFYRTLMRALGGELRALDACAPLAAPGYPRLVTLMALALASLSVAGHDRDLPRIEAALAAELGRQVFADGAHISRNADIVVEILLDLLPVSQCYAARGLPVPPFIADAIARMMYGLRAQLAAARALARFNGVGVSRPDELATVLALDTRAPLPAVAIGAAGYARLVRGATTLIADCGRPPPLEHATLAHAGCLSFELAHGGSPIIVNRGAPGPGHRGLLPDARATASHSTLTVMDQSSAHLVRSSLLERLAGSPPIAGPDRVEARLSEPEGSARLVAMHDGYLARFGLVHTRELTLSADGEVLHGRDRLGPPRGTLRLQRDLPFAIHFHLPTGATTTGNDGVVVIDLPEGPTWRLSAAGCFVSIETATDFAQVIGPTTARQIVLRGTCPGETEVAWRLDRL